MVKLRSKYLLCVTLESWLSKSPRNTNASASTCQVSRFVWKSTLKVVFTIQVAVFFGGMPIKKDEETLKNNCPHIVVGTPGRTLALARSGALNLKKIKFFVLDECDKMIGDLGFHFCQVH